MCAVSGRCYSGMRKDCLTVSVRRHSTINGYPGMASLLWRGRNMLSSHDHDSMPSPHEVSFPVSVPRCVVYRWCAVRLRRSCLVWGDAKEQDRFPCPARNGLVYTWCGVPSHGTSCGQYVRYGMHRQLALLPMPSSSALEERSTGHLRRFVRKYSIIHLMARKSYWDTPILPIAPERSFEEKLATCSLHMRLGRLAAPPVSWP